jgi:hypothetical protein
MNLSLDGITVLKTLTNTSPNHSPKSKSEKLSTNSSIEYSDTTSEHDENGGLGLEDMEDINDSYNNKDQISMAELKEIFQKCIVISEDKDNKVALADVSTLARYIKWSLSSNELSEIIINSRPIGTIILIIFFIFILYFILVSLYYKYCMFIL